MYTNSLALVLLSQCLACFGALSAAHSQAQVIQPLQLAQLRAPLGDVFFEIIDVLGRELDAKIELHRKGQVAPVIIKAPGGRAEAKFPEGPAEAYVYVYENGVPLLVDMQAIVISSAEPAYVLVNLLEGSSRNRPLRAFDRDFDLAIDRVELAMGTDPDDASSIPGEVRFNWNAPVLSTESRWYRGELHAHSDYGRGAESVRELIRRAERSRLDFLAITDRNTLAAAHDPDFKSKSVVLIPAMEWGSEEKGLALIYGPATIPKQTNVFAEAQAIALRVQAQGGIFAIAHPFFPTSPWQWGLTWVNAVEVWCRDWRHVPPIVLSHLEEWLKARQDGRLIHSMAMAAATAGHSANGQAALFWDLELSRGLKAGLIGGSNSASPKVPLGSPVTYVLADEKSLNGILDGLRRGRTIVARDLKAPVLNLTADILDDGTMDVGIGGVVPLHIPSRFYVTVEGAKGKRLEILLNGLPIRSRGIPSDEFTLTFRIVPESYAAYRARIVETPKEMAFGHLDMVAMTSPIYAQEVIPYDPTGGENLWVNIENDYFDPTKNPVLPADPSATELKPKWRW